MKINKTTGLAPALIATACVALLGCPGSDEPATTPEKDLKTLEKEYRDEAAKQINKQNADEAADELLKQIQQDETTGR